MFIVVLTLACHRRTYFGGVQARAMPSGSDSARRLSLKWWKERARCPTVAGPAGGACL